MWWSYLLKLNLKDVMESFFNIKNFKSHKWWSLFSILKTLRVVRKSSSPSSVLKTFRVLRKSCSPFSALLTLKVGRKWRSPFFSIRIFKSHKAAMEFFLSFRRFKGRKKVTKVFFSGHASLSFYMIHKFPGTIFSFSVLWLYISLTIHFNLHEESS